MRYLACALLLAGMAGLFVSCGENKPPEAQPQQQTQNLRPNFFRDLSRAQVTYSPNISGNNPNLPSTLGGADAPPTVSPAPSAPAQPQLAIPEDARWTLYCASIQGPDRFARIQQMRNFLMNYTPFKAWYIVHEAQASTLFYGFYASNHKADPAGSRAHAEREQIAKWTDSNGDQPFARCFFVEITPPDPVAPTEWNLVNAPVRSYWSLQVAAFKDNPKRKEAAVLAAKELRDAGVEAYFYHGPTISSVLVGSWPASAIKEQDFDGSKAVFDDQDAVLVTDRPLPKRYAGAMAIKDRQGNAVRRVSQTVEVVDPSLLAAMKDYPHHFTNYNAIKRTVKGPDGQPREVFNPSFLVIIPREEKSMLNESAWPGQPNPGSSAPARERPPQDNTPAGAGRLPGIR